MPNAFSKEEIVAFELLLEGFQDALVLSRLVPVFKTDSTQMARASDTIWRPQPYISQSFSGTDMTANFKNYTQLSVPASIGFGRSVPWILTALELRDALQEKRLGNSAKQKLASDINLAIMAQAANLGSLVIKRTVAATGFDDIALCDSVMNEQGVPGYDRNICLSSRDYNAMAGNLAARQTLNGRTESAFDRAYIGMVSGFDTYKFDYANALTARAALTCTVTSANQFYAPKATTTAVTLEQANVDNRFQVIPITVTSGLMKVGDAFTLAGVNAVHHITKGDTGQLKTFRITAIVTGGGATGTVQITPPIISGQGATDPELQYQNVTATPAAGAAVTFLNTVTAAVNPFWHVDSLELLPGNYQVPPDAGVAVIRASTDQGIELVFQKFYDINNMNIKYRVDTLYGVVNKQPEMSGIMLFSQT